VSFIGCGALHLLKPALLAAGIAWVLAGCALRPQSPAAPAAAATVPAVPAPGSAPGGAGTIDYAALIVGHATAMLGQPYRYGGAQPGGFDCSGLVVYAAARSGIVVPRTAHEQIRAGVRIRRAELRPGDLVFMHLAGKELHVGIAIDSRRFIHAPATGGRVRIDSLDQPPYSTGFLSARRISPSESASLYSR
jgi:cell wall-associated NlpC family hydrolase